MNPVPMDHHEKMRLRAKVAAAILVMRLVDHVLKAPLAQGEVA